MANLNVQTAKKHIRCLQMLDEKEMERAAQTIAKDLKAYVEDKFVLNEYQQRTISKIPNSKWRSLGELISLALNNSYGIDINDEPSLKPCWWKLHIELDMGSQG